MGSGEIVGVVEATEAPSSDRDLPEIAMLYVNPAAGAPPSPRPCSLQAPSGLPPVAIEPPGSVSSRPK